MPELPEVEILKNEIKNEMMGKEVASYSLRKTGRTALDGESLLPSLVGAKIDNVDRRGKMLVLGFDKDLALVIHMMLIGQVLLIKGVSEASPKALLALHFHDRNTFEIRQVALKSQHLIKKNHVEELPNIAELGIDSLSPQLTLERFRELLSGRRGSIKALLMDQRVIAGIGNTYSDEILFAAKVHPEREVGSLSDNEVESIYEQIRPVLERAIELGGSSSEQFVHLDGSLGRYQENFLVHRRGGEPCRVCGTRIEKVTIGGRTSYFCPKEQVLK